MRLLGHLSKGVKQRERFAQKENGRWPKEKSLDDGGSAGI